jgi:hypothetical protein
MANMTDALPEAHSARCLKPAPLLGDPDSIDWEGLGSQHGLTVCPDCITPEELF